jgi:hypothetical protein
MDGNQKNKRPGSVVIAINATALAAYIAFGMAPAPGGLKQIACGTAVAIIAWANCAYTWWQTASTEPPESPPDAP